MSVSKHTRSTFNKDWTDSSLHPDFSKWIAEVPKDPFSAYCIFCKKNFSLSNMAKTAVSSHAKSAKHVKSSPQQSNSSVLHFFMKDGAKNDVSSPDDVSTSVDKKSVASISSFVLNERCSKAEVIWGMKLVMSHSSFNGFNDVSEIFINMFPDSEVAKKSTFGRTKMSYLVCYGLAPFFNLSLQKSVSGKNYVICFDEALNRISQRCQMDIIIRFWCDKTNRVSSRYWTSTFLGRATAQDLLEKFREAMAKLDISLLLQISMDGPNVNLKFLKYVKAEVSPNILDLGTCGLHIVHGAFQFGHKSTNWKVENLLRALDSLFKDSPARRANFTEITGSSEFPLEFCAVRWVENVLVCERALKVFDDVKKYVEHSRKSLPGTVTCDTVISACNDKLILPKISFFSYVAFILEPFLRKFQTNQPMVPFLYENLFSVIRQLLKKIIKTDILSEVKTLDKLVSIDLDNIKNFRPRKGVDIGVVTSRYLNISGASESQKVEFLNGCFVFIKTTVKKILERTSSNYTILRAASSLNPFLLRSNAVLCEKRMDTLLHHLFSKDKISPSCAENAKLEFQLFLEKLNCEFKEQLVSYTEEIRLDDFYYALLNTQEFKNLWEVVRLVLTLSHGNAAVESGFSINKDMLVENLKEESLIGLRTVYDAVKSHGGVTKVPLEKDLLQYAKSARMRYQEALEKKREIQQKTEENEKKKRKVSQQITALQKKKMKLMTEKSAEIANIDEQISELKKMNS